MTSPIMLRDQQTEALCDRRARTDGLGAMVPDCWISINHVAIQHHQTAVNQFEGALNWD